MGRSVTRSLVLIVLAGCAQLQPPTWNPLSDSTEREYDGYLVAGASVLTGQAFMTQRGGGVVKAAGRTVTLDPATSVGIEWWTKAGTKWVFRSFTPSSPSFQRARRTTVADAEGRFRFKELPPGKYFVRTDVTWDVPYHGPQGGLVGRMVEVTTGQDAEVILSEFAQ